MQSIVEQALRKQRSVWQNLVQALPHSGVIQQLPQNPPKRILLFGVGSSHFSARLTGYTLSREIKKLSNLKNVEVVASTSMSIGTEVQPREGDWVFAFSHRGKTPVTLKALQMCKKSGAFCALVAAQGISPDPIADLYLPTSEIEKCEPHTFGMTSSVCAVTSLLLGGAILERWQFLASQHDPDLKILRAQVQSPPTVVLGEREGEWIARETALKLVEMAGVRALVFGSEEYFHGPQLFVQQSKIQEKVWYTGSLSDSRQNDISRMSIQYQAKWDESEPLSWVDCLIHFQWATLALALNLGVNPDTGI